MEYSQQYPSRAAVGETTGNLFLLLLLAIAVHALDVILRLSGSSFGFFHPMLLVYMGFAVFAALTLQDHPKFGQGSFGRSMGPAALHSLVAYFIPFVNLVCVWGGNNICSAGGVFGTPLNYVVHIAIIFAPWWPIIIMYQLARPGTGTYTLGSVYFLIWFLLLSVALWQTPQIQETVLGIQVDVPGFQPGLTIKYFSEQLWGFTVDAFLFLQGLPTQIEKGTDQFIKMSTGEYYTSKVDEKAKEQLGVWVENVKLAESKAYTDRPITVGGHLRARVLDLPIDIILRCEGTAPTADDKKATVFGAVTPGDSVPDAPGASAITVQNAAETDFDCVFDQGALPKGSQRVNVTATFNFATKSYLLSYMKQAGTRDISPVSTPQAVTTQGPVRIGMGLGTQPISIDTSKTQDITLGMTVENMWLGKVRNVRAFTLLLPKGVKVKDVNGIGAGEPTGCASLPEDADRVSCRDDVFEVYVFTQPGILAAFRGLDVSRADVRPRVHLSVTDASRLMERDVDGRRVSEPLAQHYVHAHLEYEYEIGQQVTVVVNEAEA